VRINKRTVCAPIPRRPPFFAESGVPRANALPTSTMYRYYEELSDYFPGLWSTGVEFVRDLERFHPYKNYEYFSNLPQIHGF
jgi:hypothetical protein